MEQQNKILDISKQFRDVGFSDKQILKLLDSRQKGQENSLPFLRVDIRKRFELFKEIFEACGVSKEDMYNTLSEGIVFSYLPAAFSELLDFIQKNGVEPAVFLKKMSSSSHGRAVLSWGPRKIKTNITESLRIFRDYQISLSDLIDMGLKCPKILTVRAENLNSKLIDWIKFGENYGTGFSQSIEILKKFPDILVKDIDTMRQKCDTMAHFVGRYGVTKDEWVRKSIQHPQLLFKDTSSLIRNILLYQESFKRGVFCFSQKPDADSVYLMKYLMSSPQYICISSENVKERMEYAQKLNEMGKKATTSVLYLTKAKMKKYLQDVSK